MASRTELWIWSGIVLAAGVGLVAASPATAKSEPAKPPSILPGEKVALIGDSLAVGLAVPLKKIATDAGHEFISDGRIGTRIEQWASSGWLDQMLARKPTVVLVSLGTNDMKMPDPSVEKAALSKVIERVSASGARLVWLEPPAMPFDDHGVRAMLRGSGALVLSSSSLSIPRGPDKIHPTAAGYSGWAACLWMWLTQPVGRLQQAPSVAAPALGAPVVSSYPWRSGAESPRRSAANPTRQRTPMAPTRATTSRSGKRSGRSN